MDSTIAVYKLKGETPLQALDRLRRARPELAEIKLSYAGRLDPMAEGVMLVLVGEESKNREKYLGLDKTYVTEILFGISTDTGDVLGKFKISNLKFKIEEDDIRQELKKCVGKFEQKYPAYSSKSFSGSYEDVREGKITDHVHDVEIYSTELMEVHEISEKDLLEQIKKDVANVSGDFRQQEIIEEWEKHLSDTTTEFHIAQIKLKVSSGFYVRQFAEDFGAKYDIPALALSILRERVRDWTIQDCIA